MSEQRASRIEEARRRAGNAKLALGLVAVAGFLGALGFAQASHPGSATTRGVASNEQENENVFTGSESDFEEDELVQGSFGFSGTIGPSSGGTPQVRTGVS